MNKREREEKEKQIEQFEAEQRESDLLSKERYEEALSQLSPEERSKHLGYDEYVADVNAKIDEAQKRIELSEKAGFFRFFFGKQYGHDFMGGSLILLCCLGVGGGLGWYFSHSLQTAWIAALACSAFSLILLPKARGAGIIWGILLAALFAVFYFGVK